MGEVIGADAFALAAEYFTGTVASIESSDVPLLTRGPINAPNPFNPSTTIHYAVPVAALVELVVHDVNGREVKRLVSARREVGTYQVVWDATDGANRLVASGTYLFQLTAVDVATGERSIHTGKMVLVK